MHRRGYLFDRKVSFYESKFFILYGDMFGEQEIAKIEIDNENKFKFSSLGRLDQVFHEYIDIFKKYDFIKYLIFRILLI